MKLDQLPCENGEGNQTNLVAAQQQQQQAISNHVGNATAGKSLRTLSSTTASSMISSSSNSEVIQKQVQQKIVQAKHEEALMVNIGSNTTTSSVQSM